MISLYLWNGSWQKVRKISLYVRNMYHSVLTVFVCTFTPHHSHIKMKSSSSCEEKKKNRSIPVQIWLFFMLDSGSLYTYILDMIHKPYTHIYISHKVLFHCFYVCSLINMKNYIIFLIIHLLLYLCVEFSFSSLFVFHQQKIEKKSTDYDLLCCRLNK